MIVCPEVARLIQSMDSYLIVNDNARRPSLSKTEDVLNKQKRPNMAAFRRGSLNNINNQCRWGSQPRQPRRASLDNTTIISPPLSSFYKSPAKPKRIINDDEKVNCIKDTNNVVLNSRCRTDDNKIQLCRWQGSGTCNSQHTNSGRHQRSRSSIDNGAFSTMHLPEAHQSPRKPKRSMEVVATTTATTAITSTNTNSPDYMIVQRNHSRDNLPVNKCNSNNNNNINDTNNNYHNYGTVEEKISFDSIRNNNNNYNNNKSMVDVVTTNNNKHQVMKKPERKPSTPKDIVSMVLNIRRGKTIIAS